MDIYKVEFFEFYDKDDDEEDGILNDKTVAAEDAEKAIKKTKELMKNESWIDDEFDPPVTRYLSSIVIFQVIYVSSLDG